MMIGEKTVTQQQAQNGAVQLKRVLPIVEMVCAMVARLLPHVVLIAIPLVTLKVITTTKLGIMGNLVTVPVVGVAVAGVVLQ